MIQHFSLDRVQKAPGEFRSAEAVGISAAAHAAVADQAKGGDGSAVFAASRTRYFAAAMRHRTALDAPSFRPPVIAIKAAGDILDFTEFFVPDDALEYDEAAFEKRIAQAGR